MTSASSDKSPPTSNAHASAESNFDARTASPVEVAAQAIRLGLNPRTLGLPASVCMTAAAQVRAAGKSVDTAPPPSPDFNARTASRERLIEEAGKHGVTLHTLGLSEFDYVGR